MVMLDNFDPNMIKQAITMNAGKIKLEVSGNIDTINITQKAIPGIDYLSSGGLTKNCQAIDFSMRLI